MEQPSYYSTLTADVRYDKRLKPNEKLLFSEITALSNKRGYCNASNNYFAQLYDVTTATASNWVNHLKDRGYIDVEMIYDGKQIKERRIFVNSNPIKENFNTPKEKVEYPIKKNLKIILHSATTTVVRRSTHSVTYWQTSLTDRKSVV